jgi:hypothetical protein
MILLDSYEYLQPYFCTFKNLSGLSCLGTGFGGFIDFFFEALDLLELGYAFSEANIITANAFTRS